MPISHSLRSADPGGAFAPANDFASRPMPPRTRLFLKLGAAAMFFGACLAAVSALGAR